MLEDSSRLHSTPQSSQCWSSREAPLPASPWDCVRGSLQALANHLQVITRWSTVKSVCGHFNVLSHSAVSSLSIKLRSYLHTVPWRTSTARVKSRVNGELHWSSGGWSHMFNVEHQRTVEVKTTKGPLRLGAWISWLWVAVNVRCCRFNEMLKGNKTPLIHLWFDCSWLKNGLKTVTLELVLD